MALLPNAVDVQNTPDMATFDPLPAGKYLSKVIESTLKPTSAGNGHFLEIKFTVMEGKFANRSFWSRLNLDNPDADTVKRANQELAAIARACGINTRVGDSNQLHGTPIYVTLKVRPAKGEYGPSNAATKYEPTGQVQNGTGLQQGVSEQAQAQDAAQGAGQAQDGSAATPWDKQQ